MLEAKFDELTPTFNATFESDENVFPFTMGEMTEVSTNDHRKLSNRDSDNQHPMSAITGLPEALDAVPDEALSNIDIESLLK